MSNTDKQKVLPAYRIYSVAKNDERPASWTEIGVAWRHKNGTGLNLQFNARPLEGNKIVLLEPKK